MGVSASPRHVGADGSHRGTTMKNDDSSKRGQSRLSKAVLGVASAALLAVSTAQAHAATVTTDQPDYHPGQTVTITGSAWEPGETVDMVLQEDPPLDPDLALTSVADSNGDFTNMDFTVDVFDIG